MYPTIHAGLPFIVSLLTRLCDPLHSFIYMSTTMATGSTSNITTQWTFRDGRDYVLSLTTTEMPNTISVWISDKITGEEWIGSFDDNGKK